MTARTLLKAIRTAARHRGVDYAERQGRGSHVVLTVGTCTTTVPVHQGEDIGRGLLRKIVRDLAPCLGEGWLP